MSGSREGEVDVVICDKSAETLLLVLIEAQWVHVGRVCSSFYALDSELILKISKNPKILKNPKKSKNSENLKKNP